MQEEEKKKSINLKTFLKTFFGKYPSPGAPRKNGTVNWCFSTRGDTISISARGSSRQAVTRTLNLKIDALIAAATEKGGITFARFKQSYYQDQSTLRGTTYWTCAQTVSYTIVTRE